MEDVIGLLRYYQEFKEQHGSADLALFGEWLKQQHAPQQEYQTSNRSVNQEGLNTMASYLLGNLGGFVEVWIKLSFQGLPLRSLKDFGILKTVQDHGNPSKKEVAAEVTMEHSTCIEAIRRLVQHQLLQEEADPRDKRLKRVHLTPQGQQLLKDLSPRMQQLGILLMGNLDDVEKKSLVPILDKLLQWHKDLYEQREELDIKQLYGI